MSIDDHVIYPKTRWFVLITMVVGFIAQGFVAIAPIAEIGDTAKYLNTDPGTATFVMMGMVAPGIIIAAFLSIFIVDKLGIGKTYMTCAILTIASTAVIPFLGHSLGAMTAARFVFGLSCGPIYASNARMAAEWFPINERSIITGIDGFIIFFSGAFGFAVIPALYKGINSFPGLMNWTILPVGLFLVMALVMVFALKVPKLTTGEKTDKKLEARNAKRDFRLALRDPQLYLLIACLFLFNWMLNAIADFTTGYFGLEAARGGVGFGSSKAGQIMAMMQIVMMVGALSSAWINKLVFRGSFRLHLMFGFILTGAYFFAKFPAIVGKGINPLLMLFLFVTAFSVSQGLPTILGTIVKNYPPHILGRIGSITMGLSQMGTVIGLGVSAAAYRATGSYQLPITIVSILAVIGFFLGMALKKPKSFTNIHDHKPLEESFGRTTEL